MSDTETTSGVSVGLTTDGSSNLVFLVPPNDAMSINPRFARMLAKQLNAWADYVEAANATQGEEN